jgi:PAS domain S-box-containing protein
MKKPTNQHGNNKETIKSVSTQLIKEITKAEGIINAIGDGISILDRTFTILYENKIHRDLMGDHVGEHCYKAYQKREGVCDGCPVALTFKDGKVHTLQRELQTDKEIKYMEITASPLKDAEGKIIAGIEVVRDITDRKQALIALQSSEEKYRTTIDFLDDALHVADDNLNILLINKKLLGWNERFGLETDIIGKNVFEVYPFLSSKVQEEYKSLFETGKPSKTQESTVFNGGEVITETKKIPIFEENKAIKVITIMRDITERKKVKKELKQKMKELQDFYDMALGRELRMKELKEENRKLREELEKYTKQ